MLLVQFPVRSHSYVVSLVQVGAHMRGKQLMFLSHIDVSLSTFPSLWKKKIKQDYLCKHKCYCITSLFKSPQWLSLPSRKRLHFLSMLVNDFLPWSRSYDPHMRRAFLIPRGKEHHYLWRPRDSKINLSKQLLQSFPQFNTLISYLFVLPCFTKST